jgi:hypothetical protein
LILKTRPSEKPVFRWWIGRKNTKADDILKRTLPIWVPVASEKAIEAVVLTRKPWRPPAKVEYQKYYEHRADAWRYFETQRQEANVSRPSNTPHWAVSRCRASEARDGGNRRVFLVVGEVEFKDYVATTRQLEDKSQKGQQAARNVEDWFLKDYHQVDHVHFPPLANLLAVDVNVITSDKKMIVLRAAPNGPWETSLFGFVNALEDIRRDDVNVIDPRETALRACCRKLGFNFCTASLRWLGAGLSTEIGNVSLLGEVEVPYTFREIEHFFEKRIDIERAHAIQAIDLNSDSLNRLISSNSASKHRWLAEVGMVLSMVRHSQDHFRFDIKGAPKADLSAFPADSDLESPAAPAKS